MAKPISAKVNLTGSRSHTYNGRTLFKGKPQIITNPSDIKYYQGVQGVTVKVLKEEAEKKPKAVASKKKARKMYEREELMAMKKAALSKLAKKRKILLSGDETKRDITDAILTDQSLG